MLGSERPQWMQSDLQKRPPQPKRPILTAPPPPERPRTHRNVVVGVTILTMLSLFSIFYWVGIMVAAWISPPSGSVIYLADYLTFGRSLVGLIFGVLGTGVIWQIFDSAID